METLEQRSEEGKKCAWYILGQPYAPCPTCPKYNVDCREYVPLQETEVERVSRIMKNLYKPELKKI